MTFLVWNQIILEPFVGFITTACEKHQFMKIFFRMFFKNYKVLKMFTSCISLFWLLLLIITNSVAY